MSSIDALIGKLQNVDVNNRLYHDVTINYPATELLPPGGKLYLTEPKDVAYREKPDNTAYHMSPADLEFTQLHRIGRENAINPMDTLNSQPGCLAMALERVANAPGRSTLDILTFVDWAKAEELGQADYERQRQGREEWAYYALDVIDPHCDREEDVNREYLTHSFRLTTTWQVNGGEVREVKEFRYAGIEWPTLRCLAAGAWWMGLLDNLLKRESVRAYFHVQHRLDMFDPNFATQEENNWKHQWAESDFESPNNLLLKNLFFVEQHRNGDFVTMGLDDVPPLQAATPMLINLPCGHAQDVDIYALQHLSEVDCIKAKCETCGETIMPGEDSKLALLSGEMGKRQDYLHAQESYWRAMDMDISQSAKPIKMTGYAVSHSLDEAWFSLLPPASVSPKVLDERYLPEMRPISQALYRFAVDGWEENATPRQLFDKCVQIATETSGGVLRDRAARFLERWLRRATNHAVTNRDDESASAIEGQMEGLLDCLGGMNVGQHGGGTEVAM